MKESEYQAKIINKLKTQFPSCIVIKNDPNYIQGIPDLVVLCHDKWAALEVKVSEHAPHRPNQGWYVTCMNEMSYASFIFPENESDVFFELHKHFSRRQL